MNYNLYGRSSHRFCWIEFSIMKAKFLYFIAPFSFSIRLNCNNLSNRNAMVRSRRHELKTRHDRTRWILSDNLIPHHEHHLPALQPLYFSFRFGFSLTRTFYPALVRSRYYYLFIQVCGSIDPLFVSSIFFGATIGVGKATSVRVMTWTMRDIIKRQSRVFARIRFLHEFFIFLPLDLKLKERKNLKKNDRGMLKTSREGPHVSRNLF